MVDRHIVGAPGRARWIVALAMGASLCGCATGGRYATDPAAVARGAALAARSCGTCHGLGPAGESNFPRAPAFRDMSIDPDAVSYQRKMAQLHLGPARMPPAELSLQDVGDIRAYVLSLGRTSAR